MAHIGLGRAATLKEVRTYWPAGSVWQTYDAKLNTLNHLTEPEITGEGHAPKINRSAGG